MSEGQTDAKALFRPFSPDLHLITNTNGRASLDSERSSTSSPLAAPVNGVNGTSVNGTAHSDYDSSESPMQRLQQQLAQEREEKENLAAQYRNLLSKLTTMRNTLGNKLKQDAEELDRREQLVQQLTVQNDDLSSTVETLKAELIASHEEGERTARDLADMRSRLLNETAQESMLRERELREAQSELEHCRLERDEWERIAMQERVSLDEARTTIEELREDVQLEREAREKEALELEAAREKSTNLQSVLEDFQAAKDHELHEAIRDYKSRLDEVTLSLAEFKRRALNAELQLEEINTNALRIQTLEKDVKEKNLLIGKLRHEAVIMNEHLMEALRRLRQNSSETNVDRRLVSNVLLSFLITPRADPKRFEMLSLLSTILSWSEEEREKAGLQRSHLDHAPSSFWGRSSATGSPSKGPPNELEKTDETESFSRLWVEFLLTEANQGETPTKPKPNNSLPSSPTYGQNGQSPSSSPTGPRSTRRLGSFTTAAMASSPNLALAPPPSRKGKAKELALP